MFHITVSKLKNFLLKLIITYFLLLIRIDRTYADCTSCPAINVFCHTNPSVFDGVLTQVENTDSNGCKTVTLRCSDDENNSDFAFIENDTGDFFFGSEATLTCLDNGAYLENGNPLIVSCSLTQETTVNTPTCRIDSAECCSEWSHWAEITPCSDHCGGCGTARYRRTCLTNDICPCTGDNEKIDMCNLQPCLFPRKSCCNGIAKALDGKILCLQDGQTFESPSKKCGCCPSEGIWGSWQDFSCSDKCGAYGVGVRKRVCLSEKMGCPCTGLSTASGECKIQPCLFPRSSCNANSDFRPRVLNKKILCIKSTETDPTTIPSECCPGEGLWEEWSAWSTCSTNCGGCSSATRTRVCASETYQCPCAGTSFEMSPCNRHVCSNGTCCIGEPTTLTNGDNLCQL